MFESIFFPVIFFIVGACLGSFGNVIIFRWPKEQSLLTPRSHCPACKKTISFYDNIPVISYLLLKGKCRACSAPIGQRHFWVELVSGLIFLVLYLRFGLTVTFAEYALMSWALFIASVIDYDHRLLPDIITLSGLALGLLGAWINPERHFMDALMGAFLGGGFLWLVAYLYSVVRKEEGMGGGDIKLLAWVGSILGWQAVIYTILVSSILGSLAGLILAARQKSGLKTSIPFGPFLSLAAFSYIFVGRPVIELYLQFFFPFMDS